MVGAGSYEGILVVSALVLVGGDFVSLTMSSFLARVI